MRNTRQQGFTLVELITVIVIIGALATVAFPTIFAFMPRLRLREGGQEVYRAIQLTRTEAIKRNKVVTLVLKYPMIKCSDLPGNPPQGIDYVIRAYDRREKNEAKQNVMVSEGRLPPFVAPCEEEKDDAKFAVNEQVQISYNSKGLPLKLSKRGYLRLGNTKKDNLYVLLEPSGAVRVLRSKPKT